jgi:phospholipid-translocating ATPase
MLLRVVETLEKLREAGITTWMLTGDKKETALNLANAAGLIASPAKVVDLCEVNIDRDVGPLLEQLYRELPARVYSRDASLVVDGKSITTIMKSDDLRQMFTEVCSNCPSVVACRLSPIQKSQLVRMVKDEDPGYVTAAIGDGGNDISMIQVRLLK